jgi:transcriptional regulator with XRE-family HTH domain
MTASAPLLRAIKSTLRSRGLTYRKLAELLGVSEPTVKRDLSKGHFSLKRLDQICAALGLTLTDLLQAPEAKDLVTQLSEAQELALISQPRYFVVTYLLVNDWKFREITEAFRMDENELIEILLRLDQLKIIEYRPPHRVRKLTARNFAWRKDGPVHSFFVTRFVPEFFQSAFDGAGDAFRFVGGMLSPGSLSQFKASLERLAVEFEELARADARLPLAERDGCSAILAVRSWEFSEFTRLRRTGGFRGNRPVQSTGQRGAAPK